MKRTSSPPSIIRASQYAGAIGIAAPDRLDEGGNDIVVLFTLFVVQRHFLSRGLHDGGVVDHLARVGRGAPAREFQQVHRVSGRRLRTAATRCLVFLSGARCGGPQTPGSGW
ncbi:MAG: hypothetical protein MZV64_01740 [Ignavibacteriales bacterium]|nr:hypothetical protein [Ignavibacteriales bacterium]